MTPDFGVVDWVVLVAFLLGTTFVGHASRHVKGLYTLTADDLVQRRDFPDPVALGGYPIDIHSPERAATDSVSFAEGTTCQISIAPCSCHRQRTSSSSPADLLLEVGAKLPREVEAA